MKLKELLLLESKIINVPKPVLDKLSSVYNYITNNLDTLKAKAPTSVNDRIYIPDQLKSILKFKDLAGNDLKVSIGFYNDPTDAGAGRMDTVNDIMMVNLPFVGDEDSFVELGYHELVHAMDPKVRDQKLFGKEFAKKGAEPAGSKYRLSKSGGKSEFEKNIDKYYKSPWEFDAFTGPLITKLQNTYNKAQNKQDFKKSINDILVALQTRSVSDVVEDPDLQNAGWYFSNKQWTTENWPAIKQEFTNELEKIKAWIGKPTLYKRFKQRYSKIFT